MNNNYYNSYSNQDPMIFECDYAERTKYDHFIKQEIQKNISALEAFGCQNLDFVGMKGLADSNKMMIEAANFYMERFLENKQAFNEAKKSNEILQNQLKQINNVIQEKEKEINIVKQEKEKEINIVKQEKEKEINIVKQGKEKEIWNLKKKCNMKENKIIEQQNYLDQLMTSFKKSINESIHDFNEESSVLCEGYEDMLSSILSFLFKNGNEMNTYPTYLKTGLNNYVQTLSPLIRFIEAENNMKGPDIEKINIKYIDVVEKIKKTRSFYLNINNKQFETLSNLLAKIDDMKNSVEHVDAKLKSSILCLKQKITLLESNLTDSQRIVTDLNCQVKHLNDDINNLNVQKATLDEIIRKKVDNVNLLEETSICLNEKIRLLSDSNSQKMHELAKKECEIAQSENLIANNTRKIACLQNILRQQMYIAKQENEAALNFQRDLFLKKLQKNINNEQE